MINRLNAYLGCMDSTIPDKFNPYRFADYKAKAIDLLKRVTTVSVGTMEVVRGMEKAKR